MGTIEAFVRKRPQVSYYIGLFLAVLVIFFGANAVMLAVGSEPLWHSDGQPLYMSFLAWEGQQLRAAWDTFISGGGIQIPFFTYSLGYGADAPLTMSASLNDPLNLFVVFFPTEYTMVFFTLEIIARMMLAGVTFSLYCFARGLGRKATGVAAIAYVCCGFVIFWGVIRHPKFINWAILLPLILQGADRLFERKSPVMFIVSIALQFFISIYYGYMSCFVLLVYCIVKYFFAPRDRSIADFAKLVGKFALCLVIAFCLAGLFSLPQVITLLSQNRATGGAYVPLLFTPNYYYRIGAELIGGDLLTRGIIFGGYVTVGLLAFVLCGKHLERDVRRPWLIALVLCCIGVLIPKVSSVFNGFGYVTDRWMLIIGFVSAYIMGLTVPKLHELDKRDWKRLAIGVGVIAVWAAAFAIAQIWSTKGARGVIWPACATAVFIGCYAIMRWVAQRWRSARSSCIAGSLLTICCLAITCFFFNSPIGDNHMENFNEAGTASKQLTVESPAAAVAALDDDTLFRHSYPRVYNVIKNSSLSIGNMGIDYYSSMYNQVVDNFRQELGISDHYLNFSFVGSDSRLAIEKLTGAKYYVTQEADAWQAPYSFSNINADWGDYRVYESANPVGIAFSSDRIIPRAQYDNLSMVQKSEALLQGTVLKDDVYSGDFKQADLKLTSQPVDFKVSDEKDLTFEDGVVHVRKEDASMKISFSGMRQSETNLCMTNLAFRPYTPLEETAALGQDPSFKTYIQEFLWDEPTRFLITVKSGKLSKNIHPATPKGIQYGGKVNWTINMGYRDEAQKEFTITFDKPGDYTFDTMEVVCQPVEPVLSLADQLAARSLEDIELHTNGMSAAIDVEGSDPELAVFTVAYSKGWSATVDGQPADVVNADSAFMAVKVEGEGRHVVEFSYITPGVVEGLWLSVAGLVVLVGIIIYNRLRPSRKAKATAE